MTSTAAAQADSTEQFVGDWQAWHRQREADLAAPRGWLSITRLEWLDREPTRYPGIPGTWSHDGTVAHLEVEPGEELAVDGTRTFELGAVAPGEVIDAGDTAIEVVRRGDGYLIRIHDPAAPAVADFRGVPAFEPDPSWVVAARFEAYPEPQSITVGAVTEGLEHVYSSPGELVFERDGAEHRLIAFNGKADGFVQVLFTDDTSGVSTYAANRSLAVAVGDWGSGSVVDVVIDFNRALNLPCAFVDFATCPLPPAQNRLPFAITAGEKIPYERG